MNPIALLRRAVMGGALLGVLAAPSASAAIAPVPTPLGTDASWPTYVEPASPANPASPADRVTLREIEASNAEVRMAYMALMAMWQRHFEQIGVAFEPPALLRYRGTVRTSCGVMPQNNAVYCPQRNAIYFDEVFIASVAKVVGRELGTDGDMASVGVIAHEVGHAVAMQLGFASRFTYANESTADCLAGAFARHSQKDGSLEAGDLEEAFLGMALAGDPSGDEVSEVGDDRRRIRASLMSHGTREQRMQNFRAGLERGPSACLPHFELN